MSAAITLGMPTPTPATLALTILATSVLAGGCAAARTGRPTVIAAAAPVTVAMSSASVVAPPQRLEVSNAAWDTIREVELFELTQVDGRPMVILGRGDDHSGTGKIRVVAGGDSAIALRAPSEAELAVADRVGEMVTVLGDDGACDAVITDLHVGAFIEFEAAAGETHSGADIWDAAVQRGGVYVLGELASGGCLDAAAGGLVAPAGTVELGVAPASDVVRGAVEAAMSQLPAFAELQHDYLAYQSSDDASATPGRWTDAGELSVQVVRAGRDILAVADVAIWGECGGWGGELFSVWRVTGSPTAPQLERLYDAPRGGTLQHAVVGPDGLAFQLSSTATTSLSVPTDVDYGDEGCGC